MIGNIKNMQIKFSMLEELSLPSKFSKKLEKLKELGRGLKIVPSALNYIFEVQNARYSAKYRVFNVKTKKCSCKNLREFDY